MKIGVFLPNWVGDVCMAIPALRSLRENSPSETEIVALGRPVSRMVLQDQPWVNRYLVYKPKAKPPFLNRRGLVAAMRRERFDAILLLTNSLGTAAMAALSGSPRRIGYNRDGRGWLLTDRIPVERKNGELCAVPAIQYYSKVIEAFTGATITDFRMQLHTPQMYFEQASDLFRSIGFVDSAPTLVINNNAASSIGRLIPEDVLQKLCQRIVEETPYQVLLHGGPAEREQPARIVAALAHRRVQSMSAWKDLPLGLSQAVLARAAVVLTTDSGIRHMAVALDRPVITIYGATDPRWTLTFNRPEVAIEPTVACHPCWKDKCPLQVAGEQYQCVKQLSLDRVMVAIQSIADQT
jgi:heptosyltransferase-2